jgi:hypothetical protein
MNSTPATDVQIASPSSTRSTGPFLRFFNRIFSRHLINMVVLIVLPMVSAAALNSNLTLINDPDIWWHLADARFLFTTHHFIQTDPYSFTVAGHHWINWEWLAELPFWLSYKTFGLRGIYLLSWLGLCGNILFVYWRGYWNSRHAGAAFWAAAVGIALLMVTSGPRMILLAYLAMSAELAILEAAARGKKQLLWLLPPLFCLWINLHGTWFIGIALLGLYIVCGLASLERGMFAQKAFTAEERKRLLGMLAASVVAMLANPYGWRLLWNPLDMMLNQKLSITTIEEWQPLNLSKLEGICVVVAIVLMIIANCVRGRKWKLYELGFVLLAWYAAIAHARFSALAAVLTVPLLAADFERSFCTTSDTKTIPAMNALMAAGALCILLFMFPSESVLQKKLESSFPLQTIRSVQPAWRTFDWDHVGGMMAFESKPSFIDSRFDSFDHNGVLSDYLMAMNLVNTFEILDRYRIDHVLVSDGQPISYLLKHTPGWKETMREKLLNGEYVMYARDPGTAIGRPGATQH